MRLIVVPLLVVMAAMAGCSHDAAPLPIQATRPSTTPSIRRYATTQPFRPFPGPYGQIQKHADGPVRHFNVEGESRRIPSTTQPIIHCFNQDLVPFEDMIYREAKQRFANPVIIIGHGCTRNGDWILVPDINFDGPWDIDELASVYSYRYVDCDIVFWVCNPDGLTINVPRVWYFRQSVWVSPDRSTPAYDWVKGKDLDHEKIRDFMYSGSVWELYTQNTWR